VAAANEVDMRAFWIALDLAEVLILAALVGQAIIYFA
jgi:hypothetical protein